MLVFTKTVTFVCFISSNSFSLLISYVIFDCPVLSFMDGQCCISSQLCIYSQVASYTGSYKHSFYSNLKTCMCMNFAWIDSCLKLFPCMHACMHACMLNSSAAVHAIRISQLINQPVDGSFMINANPSTCANHNLAIQL